VSRSTETRDQVAVLFVCLGNICRSPTAEGVFRALVERAGLNDRVTIDSAGTGHWHVGSPPDRRAVAHASKRGYDLSVLRARQVERADFERFDLVVAMDLSNAEDLAALAPDPEYRPKVRLLLEFADERFDEQEVPDPYTGGAEGFEHVLDLVENACAGLLDEVRARLSGTSDRGGRR
jgi:protein-tyrosine phosphatase